MLCGQRVKPRTIPFADDGFLMFPSQGLASRLFESKVDGESRLAQVVIMTITNRDGHLDRLLEVLGLLSSCRCPMLTIAPGHTATVFGATGQLGRYIVNRLGTCNTLSFVGNHMLITAQLVKDAQL